MPPSCDSKDLPFRHRLPTLTAPTVAGLQQLHLFAEPVRVTRCGHNLGSIPSQGERRLVFATVESDDFERADPKKIPDPQGRCGGAALLICSARYDFYRYDSRHSGDRLG